MRWFVCFSLIPSSHPGKECVEVKKKKKMFGQFHISLTKTGNLFSPVAGDALPMYIVVLPETYQKLL